jgi:hypothetical protein
VGVVVGWVGVCLWVVLWVLCGLVMLSYEHKTDPCQSHGEPDCKKPSDKPVAKKKCCEFKLDQQKLEQAAQQKLTQFAFVWIAPESTFPLVFPTVLITQQEVLTYTNSSPPLYGKQLLYSLHVLRV